MSTQAAATAKQNQKRRKSRRREAAVSQRYSTTSSAYHRAAGEEISGGHCPLQFIGALILLASGVGQASVGAWQLLDPARSFVLDIVDFSEDDPLLKFAACALLFSAGFTLFTAFVGWLGAYKLERCLLSSFACFVLLLTFAHCAMLALTAAGARRFPTEASMGLYLANISWQRYGRDAWVLPVMDHVQYYGHCCGGNEGPADYFLAPYLRGFWFQTNTERGTRSYVPPSCCKQTQNARAWALQPIDPMCGLYWPWTKAFNDSVNTKSCAAPTMERLREATTAFYVTIGAALSVDIICALLGAHALHKSRRATLQKQHAWLIVEK